MIALIKDGAELFKQFMDNVGFKRWMSDSVFVAPPAHSQSAILTNSCCNTDDGLLTRR